MRPPNIAALAVIIAGVHGTVAFGADAPLTAALAGGKLHVTAAVADGSANTQLLIDADGDAKTGYRTGDYAGGFETMVEGVTVHRFAGTDQAAWSWTPAGQATRKLDGKTLTIDVDAALLGGRSATAGVVLRSLSPTYQLLASVPAGTAMPVDLSGQAKPAAAAEKAGGFTATATQDGTDMVVQLTAPTAVDLNTVLVFFDTDANAATGFAPPADPRFGFEMMVQGASLVRHEGKSRDAWAWTAVAPVKQTVSGTTAEVRFNASLLKAMKPAMAAWQMSPDWQTRVDGSPKDAAGKPTTVVVPLDKAKLKAALAPADVPVAAPRADAGLPPRQRFATAKSYACYYGANMVGPLSHVDAAILHVPAMTAENVATLNRVGTVTIGYISVGEDEKLRDGNGRGFDGKASWYFDKDKDGKPDMNGVWGSVYANAADPLWRADRVAEAKRLCDEVGFAGIFLDTVETVDVYTASRAGMIQLIGELRAALPDKVIVINRGFSLLDEPAVSGKIDGLMYESFTTSYDFDSKQYITFQPQDLDATRATMVGSVMPAMKTYSLRCLALDYCQPEQSDRVQLAFDRAATFGMLPAVAPISLDLVYDTAKVVAHPDDKYLSVQATPALMRATLAGPRNGFPAGTTVTPSSCFMGYDVATVVDGKTDHSGVPWARAAWASADQAGAEQQLRFDFPSPVSGGTLRIYYAYDNNSWYPSRQVAVEASGDGVIWKPVTRVTDNAENVFACPLPAGPIKALRVVQPAGGGSVQRPNLMWVQQVTRTP